MAEVTVKERPKSKIYRCKGGINDGKYVIAMVDGLPIFGCYEDAMGFTAIDYAYMNYNRYHAPMGVNLVNISKPCYMDKDLSYICDLKGYTVLNINGKRDNLKFVISAYICIFTNTAVIKYGLWAFEKGMDCYINEEYDDYGVAVDRYNELSERWNANREEIALK